jgi:hypothetical protein
MNIIKIIHLKLHKFLKLSNTKFEHSKMQKSASSDSLLSMISLAMSMEDNESGNSDIQSEKEFLEELANYLDSENESMDDIQENYIEKSVCSSFNEERKIYEGSQLNVNQFNFLFLFIVHKMKLPLNQRDNLFKFIKYLLPEKNNLNSSYSSIIKHYLKAFEKPTLIKFCSFCELNLVNGICNNADCSKPENLPKGVRKNYETIIFNAEQQIIDVVERHWVDIQDYKSKNSFCISFNLKI